MPLYVNTARIGFKDPDALDITRKSAKPEGLIFAPSWAILGPMLRARKDGKTEELWPSYVEQYTAEMRTSYREHRAGWDALLARPRVVLLCYCTDPTRCHRSLLANILVKLGAIDRGEYV